MNVQCRNNEHTYTGLGKIASCTDKLNLINKTISNKICIFIHALGLPSKKVRSAAVKHCYVCFDIVRFN